MNKEEYHKLVKSKLPKENRIKDAFIAFFSGGTLGAFMQFLSFIFIKLFNVTQENSYMIVTILIIAFTSFLTGLGVFDNLIKKFKCGLLIPTTGFAHSVASAILDYKQDGAINGIGANCFKLAGSVLLYGIMSAFILCLLKVVIVYV